MKRSPRGFAILIVLAVLAAASVVIATQLASVEGQQGMQIRVTQEMKARDVAERCLEIADAFAEAHANANADFDGLLDPNGTIEANGDDFLPPANLLGGTSTIVTAPPSASGTMYRYRAFQIGSEGTCLIRYDDNSDDSNPHLVAAVTGTGEGTGIDLPQRDRDRTIVTTVVGLVPQQADPSTAYAKAHARATVRRVRSMPTAPTDGAAIEAGGAVTMNGDVCGSQAGVKADSVSGGLCVCGALDAQLVSGSQGPGCDCPDAPCPASTGSDTTAGDRLPPNVVVPTYDDLLANEAFGGPDTTGNNIGAATYPAIAVYFRDSAAANPANGNLAYSDATNTYQPAGSTDVFAWDRNDNVLTTTLPALTLDASSFTTCNDTAAVDPLPRPCKWTLNAAGKATAATCAAAESPCWKLIARLGDGIDAVDVDMQSRGRAEHAAALAFRPRGGDLPNFKGAGNTVEWRDLTSPASCTTCGGATNVVIKVGSNYTFPTAAIANVPSMVAIVDTIAAATTIWNLGTLTSGFAKITLLTNSQVTVPSALNQCCANCVCPSDWCKNDGSVSKAVNGPGFSIRTNQACNAAVNNVGVFGTVMCKNLNIDLNNHCYAGGIITTEPAPGTLPCPGIGVGFCDTNSSICAKNNPILVGDMIAGGNICVKNNFEVIGTIQTQGSLGWMNNAEVEGNIKAVGSITGASNAIIIFSPSGAAVLSAGRPNAMWMDATW